MGRIVFINRFYRPDHSATAQILTDLAERLAADGKSVCVLTSGSMYSTGERIAPNRETLGGVDVCRVWTTRFGRRTTLGRAVDYLTFYVSTFFVALITARAGDVFVAKTDPPLISVVIAAVCKLRGVRMVNWIQDLFPEVAEASGMALFRSNAVSGLLRGVRTWSLRAAGRNVAIGDVMAARLIEAGLEGNRVTVVPNWVVGPGLHPVQPADNAVRAEWRLQDKFVVGYSGNLGRAHDHETILACILELRDDPDVHFVFVGGGSGMDWLRERVRTLSLGNVSFKPYQSLDALAMSLSAPDAHLVTLLPEMEGLIVPSKVYGILAVHRPILFIGDADGEIGREIRAAGCGRTFGSADRAELVSCIRSLCADRTAALEMGRAAGRLYESKYDKEISLAKMAEALTS